MADPNQPGAETDPASAEGKTGLQGGYGGDTGFASDQAQGLSGQAASTPDQGEVFRDGQGDLDGDPDGGGLSGSASASDTRAGSDVGGSSSGGEPRSNPYDKLRDERHEASPAGTAAKVAADVTEDIGGVLGEDDDDLGSSTGRSADAGGYSGENRSFGGGGGSGSGLQSGGHASQPGTGVKQTATDFGEDEGHFDRGERHQNVDRDPEQSGRGPQANHQKGAF